LAEVTGKKIKNRCEMKANRVRFQENFHALDVMLAGGGVAMLRGVVPADNR